MNLEVYVEESDTAGSYHLKHVCPEDDLVYTLSLLDGASLGDCTDPLDSDCSEYSSGAAATPLELELINMGDLDTFYMYLDGYSDATLGF